MAIDNIVEKIVSDAEAEAGSIINKAKKAADFVISEADKAAREEKQKVIDKKAAAAEALGKRFLAEARLGANKEALAAKQHLIDEIFKEAITALKELPKEPFIKAMSLLILNNIEKGSFEVIPSEHDKAKIDRAFIDDVNKSIKSKGIEAEVFLSKETAKDLSDGFILKGETFLIRNSMQELISSNKDSLRAKVIGELFK